MAKKRASKMSTVKTVKATLPVRLDLTPKDHARLERCARGKGLNKAAYARMAVLERIKADEREGGDDE